MGKHLSAGHATSLRLLLLVSGDVEPHPGPEYGEQQLRELPIEQLQHALTVLNEGNDEFQMPATKTDMAALLNAEKPGMVRIALSDYLNQVPQNNNPSVPAQPPPNGSPSTSSHPGSANNSFLVNESHSLPTKGVKLDDFDPREAKIWFDKAEIILDGYPEFVKKKSLMRSITPSVIKEAGVDLTQSSSEIRNRIVVHYEDSDDTKLKQMLSEVTLGDRKPSAVLRDMQHKAPGNDKLIRMRLFQILPEVIPIPLCLNRTLYRSTNSLSLLMRPWRN